MEFHTCRLELYAGEQRRTMWTSQPCLRPKNWKQWLHHLKNIIYTLKLHLWFWTYRLQPYISNTFHTLLQETPAILTTNFEASSLPWNKAKLYWPESLNFTLQSEPWNQSADALITFWNPEGLPVEGRMLTFSSRTSQSESNIKLAPSTTIAAFFVTSNYCRVLQSPMVHARQDALNM